MYAFIHGAIFQAEHIRNAFAPVSPLVAVSGGQLPQTAAQVCRAKRQGRKDMVFVDFMQGASSRAFLKSQVRS